MILAFGALVFAYPLSAIGLSLSALCVLATAGIYRSFREDIF